MIHNIEFSQIGSRGTILLESSFGLSFTADLLIDRKVKRVGNRRIFSGVRRERVIKLLSPCCGATFDEFKVTSSNFVCHVCKHPAPWGVELLDFNMSLDSEFAAAQWEPILSYWFSDLLENSLVAYGAFNAVEEAFREIKEGKRTREVMEFITTAEV